MQFQNAIITEQGVRIFQAALANNPVVFTKCLFSGSPTPLTPSMTALPEPTWGDGHVTNYASNDSGGDFIIYASATNATDYGYAYGYGIYGYLQNEGIENEKLLVVANYDGNVTYVSEASGPYTRFHFAITIKLSMANDVISIDPRYNGLVSSAAFQDLANRTVTTHSAADAMVGENQIVRGQKHFYDTTYFGGNSNAPYIEIAVDRENDSMYLNAEHESQQIRIQMKPKDYGDDSNNNVYVNTNISPSGDGTVSLGSNEHKWLELNTYYVWASDTIGVSSRYGRTGIKSDGIEFLNANDDSIGTIGILNDTTFNIDGNGRPVHITILTVDSGMSVVGSTELQGSTYVRSLLWANDDIRCDGSMTINSVTLTGVGNMLSVNKSTTVSGDVTCARVFMSSNVMGINGGGGEPYYIGVNNGVLQIGMNNSGTNISGGGLKVSSLNATRATISDLTVNSADLTLSALNFTDDAQLDNGNYPFIYQTPETMTNPQIPIGCMFMAFVSCSSPILMGNRIPAAATINTVDLIPDDTGNVGMSLNALVIQRSNVPNHMGFVALSPVTFWKSSLREYQNITLVMRVA